MPQKPTDREGFRRDDAIEANEEVLKKTTRLQERLAPIWTEFHSPAEIKPSITGLEPKGISMYPIVGRKPR